MRLLAVLAILLTFMACNYHMDKTHDNSAILVQLLQNPQSLGFDTLKETIFQDKCFVCHGAGKSDLSTYDKFFPKVKKVLNLITQNKMPKNPNPPLSALEKQVIAQWINIGAPEFAKDPVNIPKPEPLTPTFHSIKANIIDKKCISCHVPGGDGEYYPLDTYEDTVDPIFGSLKPGDPDHSDMVIYISKPDTDKDRMPPPENQPRLSQEEINAIYTWIKNGAKND